MISFMCIKINWITQNYNEWCCHNCIRGLCDINTANTKNRSVSQTLFDLIQYVYAKVLDHKKSCWMTENRKATWPKWRSSKEEEKNQISDPGDISGDWVFAKAKMPRASLRGTNYNVENGSVAALILGALTTLVQHPSFVGNMQDHSASAL